MDHRHLLFLRLIESKKALGLALNFILKRVVDTVVDQIEEADVAGGMTQVGQEGRFIRGGPRSGPGRESAGWSRSLCSPKTG
ncbi:hypothetical protein [Klebsiella pneumoniae IS39]|nr:hypothetical protein [Klebsiella pneumoniae IS39]